MVHYSNLPDDILRYLCQTMRMERLYGLMNLSGVDRRTREIALSSIFDQISLPRRLSENQESWVGLEETINVILSNQAIVSSVRTLDVYVYGYSKSEGKLPGTIFTLLFSFPKISTLSIRMGNKYCSQTQEELGDQSNSDTKWIFLTEYVLQLESLVIESIAHGGPDPHFSDDIQRLGVKHPGLKKLYCQDACFTRNVLEIAHSFPDLREIGLRYGMGEGSTNSVLNHLSCYRMLPKLERLLFPAVSDLGLGYDPPECGNPFFRDPGLGVRLAAKAKEVTEQLLEGIQREVMAPGGPCLQTVVIGETVYACSSKGRFQKSRIIRRTGRDRRTIVEEDIEEMKTISAGP